MKVEHAVHPGLYPPRPMVLEVRECATLGTYFADVYLNGKLYASQVSRKVAETFVQHPHLYISAFIDVETLRRRALEKDDAEAVLALEALKKRGAL